MGGGGDGGGMTAVPAMQAGVIDGIRAFDQTLLDLGGGKRQETAVDANAIELAAATLAELKKALPDSDAAFRESCIEGGCTLVQAQAEWGDRRFAGALLGETHSRIVRIGEFHVDIVPAGTLIVLRNRDVAGVIGRVGTLLGDHGINIAEYHQARQAKGGDALAAVAVDGDVDTAVRDALLELDEVSKAVVVRLG